MTNWITDLIIKESIDIPTSINNLVKELGGWDNVKSLLESYKGQKIAVDVKQLTTLVALMAQLLGVTPQQVMANPIQSTERVQWKVTNNIVQQELRGKEFADKLDYVKLVHSLFPQKPTDTNLAIGQVVNYIRQWLERSGKYDPLMRDVLHEWESEDLDIQTNTPMMQESLIQYMESKIRKAVEGY